MCVKKLIMQSRSNSVVFKPIIIKLLSQKAVFEVKVNKKNIFKKYPILRSFLVKQLIAASY